METANCRNTNFVIEIDSGNDDKLARQFDQEWMSDVCFLVGESYEHRIYAHRFHLAIHNQYFERLFYGKLHDGKETEIRLTMPQTSKELSPTGVPYLQFRALLQSLYTNKFDGSKFTLLEMVVCLRLADMFEFTQLIDELEIIIRQNSDLSNMVDVSKVMLSYGRYFTSERFSKIFDQKIDWFVTMEEDKIKNIPKELLKIILECEKLSVKEVQVYNFAKMWLQVNGESKEVLNCVSESLRTDKIQWRDLLTIKDDGIIPSSKIVTAMSTWVERYEVMLQNETKLGSSKELKVSVKVLADDTKIGARSEETIIGDFVWVLEIVFEPSKPVRAFVTCVSSLTSRFSRCTPSLTHTVRISSGAIQRSGLRSDKFRSFSRISECKWMCNLAKHVTAGETITVTVNVDIS